VNAVITTQLRPYVFDADTTRIVTFGAPAPDEGTVIDVRSNSRFLGTYRVLESTTTTLSDLSEEDTDTLHPAYKNPAALWRAVEVVYGSGLPGEFSINIITLVDVASDLGVIYLHDMEEDEVDETTETALIEDGSLEEYEEEFEDLEPFEKFEKSKKSVSWDD